MIGSVFDSQFIRFCVVGGIGFMVDAGILQLLAVFTTIDLYIGRIVSYLLAATCTWLLNRRFTFSNPKTAKPHKEWSYYVTLNAIGGGINYGVYAFCLLTFETVRAWPVLGVAIGSAVGLMVNFTTNKYWVFRTVGRHR